MSRSILKNLIPIVCICIFFTVVSIFNNTIKDEYPDAANMKFGISEMLKASDFAEYTIDDTVVYRSDNTNAELFGDCYYALLINETDKQVIASKNAHERMYPASMTKYMTAMVVCDKINSGDINLNSTVTLARDYDLTYDGVAPADIFYGDEIAVKDLLYGLMIESNNYYALILADYVAGSEEAFCALMNQKAKSIGATGTHYMNPHGLDDPEHYSTAYDTYLITKEAYKYDLIREIDEYDSYSYSYISEEGYLINREIFPTNYFLNGNVDLPSGFDVHVWKTGTTDGAGNCLSMYVTKNGKTYIVIASSGDSKQVLYDSMVKLLCLVK
ncbi:MAG: D-alanyl-D-alanine carboxypeptidase [Lachnospiraceae bacterium]|nr:D-alanyl-D-alanine carboxypeptidase [Lachnospiraceae bacterium]